VQWQFQHRTLQFLGSSEPDHEGRYRCWVVCTAVFIWRWVNGKCWCAFAWFKRSAWLGWPVAWGWFTPAGRSVVVVMSLNRNRTVCETLPSCGVPMVHQNKFRHQCSVNVVLWKVDHEKSNK
jgi:hypothetical protein